MLRCAQAEYAEREKKNRVEVATIRKQASRVQLQIDRIVSAIAEGSDAPVADLMARLKKLDTERGCLADRLRLAEANNNVVTLHPAAIEGFRANVIAFTARRLPECKTRPVARLSAT